MMEASPTSPFIMPEAELLFEILVIALDAPSRFRDVDQRASAHTRGQGAEPVFRWFRLSFWPFDQTPFLRPWRCPVIIAMCRADAYGGEARCQRGIASLSPGHAAPGTGGQADRQFLRGNRFSFVVSTDQRRRPSVATPLLWRQWHDARWPQAGGGLNADHIRETERGDAVTKLSVDTIPGIGEHRRGCDTGPKSGAD